MTFSSLQVTMALFETLFLLTSLISVFSAGAEDAGRIVNGTEVPEGKFPFVVSMQFDGAHFCGGSILNKNWMVTAAHCAVGLNNYLPNLRIVSSTNKLSSGGFEHKVINISIHANFILSTFKNDIALMKVCPPFLVGSAVKLPSKDQQLAENVSITVIGWGRTSTYEPTTDLLMESDVLVLSDEKCSNFSTDQNSQLCAYLPGGMLSGDCYGDSGGPVFLKDHLTQVGIVSFSANETCAVYPDVYTEVAHYVGWISDRIN